MTSIPRNPHSASAMPPKAPLSMHRQSFWKKTGATHGLDEKEPRFWRLGVFAPAALATLALVLGIGWWLANGGLTTLEKVLLVLIGASFAAVALSFATAVVGAIGAVRVSRPATSVGPVEPISVALLVPIYNEDVGDVFGNAAAMLRDLQSHGGTHHYSLFLLSDTQDAAIAWREWAAYQLLRAQLPSDLALYYRRRAKNTDRKVGNLTDWIEHWGADYEAMLVLDADSLMSGRAVRRLSDILSTDPEAGLIQSCPKLVGAQSLFARAQQFASAAYGPLLARGLALWTGREGNYWGHNAIIRTRAFAECAGLPYLRGLDGSKRLILSHDFVEAALLRRAGWGVRLVPELPGSYEETPASLIDHAIRDRRWCQGNLQHLRLVFARGFHHVTRFHLFHGAFAYLMSPVWFALLIIWALLGTGESNNVIAYFSEANPLYPDWPVMNQMNSAVFLALTYGMLLAPKVIAVIVTLLVPRARRVFGGGGTFVGAAMLELLLSVAYAPILMVQQTLAVLGTILGRRVTWNPQCRDGQGYGFSTLIRFHWLETILGAIITAGLISGLVPIWLLPIAASLLLAVPLSALSAWRIGSDAPKPAQLSTPETLRAPPIVQMAQVERARLKSQIDAEPLSAIPAQ
ncbi:glucans biosynthesis glucosyltransferase MdoH [Actibacterium sp. 188UL27-1]|uniref:glucans biosynthesis glucosyltransferase MdoH n=1 Tax=Actibacterium sp. 188UL27-1 TaxID=2786961 RepID=UPI00195D65B6|nr:glucans biosynthesis glucosyltransferase MdoH [Actibacterium sp. 188UL27-1]MBM7066135.1 glucans biosynthesis glucosyltransferase MdoH [Actibacterium sp. 188UL27-1]